MKSKKMSSRTYRIIHVVLFAALLALILLCLCVGKYSLTPAECIRIFVGKLFHLQAEWNPMDEKMLLGVRLPRVIAAVFV